MSENISPETGTASPCSEDVFMPAWLTSWAEERSGEQLPHKLWHDAGLRPYRVLHRAGLSDEQIRQLFDACPLPRHLLPMARALGELAGEVGAEKAWKRIMRAVDGSTASLASWVEAIALFSSWLEGRGMRRNLPSIFGYLECCAEAAAKSPVPVDFPSYVRDMLGQFGFQATGDTAESIRGTGLW